MVDCKKLESFDFWKRYDPISLSEMGSVKLMNRIDTKFLMKESDLLKLLDSASGNYRVQVVDGKKIASYDSLYFDTFNLEMFTRHHDRQLKRNKIRTRRYVDSDISFLEVKIKNNKGRTKKKRIQIENSLFENFKSSSEAINFLEGIQKYKSQELIPQLHTVFNRITLVDKQKTERLTIDMNLRFINVKSGVNKELGPLCIVELKQDGLVHSKMKDLLLQMRVQQYKISKYCIGISMTDSSAKYNRFKKKLIYIKKLTELQSGSQN